jgi:hypothetical protein
MVAVHKFDSISKNAKLAKIFFFVTLGQRQTDSNIQLMLIKNQLQGKFRYEILI